MEVLPERVATEICQRCVIESSRDITEHAKATKSFHAMDLIVTGMEILEDQKHLTGPEKYAKLVETLQHMMNEGKFGFLGEETLQIMKYLIENEILYFIVEKIVLASKKVFALNIPKRFRNCMKGLCMKA